LYKLNPFSRKNLNSPDPLNIPYETIAAIKEMKSLHPHYWEAIQDVAFKRMNLLVREMVIADKDRCEKFAIQTKAIDNFILLLKNTGENKAQFDEKADEQDIKSSVLDIMRPKPAENIEDVTEQKETQAKEHWFIKYINSRDMRK
jgi:hypothetical protein